MKVRESGNVLGGETSVRCHTEGDLLADGRKNERINA